MSNLVQGLWLENYLLYSSYFRPAPKRVPLWLHRIKLQLLAFYCHYPHHATS